MKPINNKCRRCRWKNPKKRLGVYEMKPITEISMMCKRGINQYTKIGKCNWWGYACGPKRKSRRYI